MVSAEDSSPSSSSSDVVDWNSSEIEDRTVSDFSVSGVAEAVGEQLLDFRMARFIAKKSVSRIYRQYFELEVEIQQKHF
jgi:hypothetical protein